MLTAKGYRVSLRLLERGWIHAAPSAALLHDETGRTWPSCSGLITSFERGGSPLESVPPAVCRYFGCDEYVVRSGVLKVPPRSLGQWSLLGTAEEIHYTRRGEYAADYYHPFEERGALWWKVKLPTVYRLGSALRLELGPGCEWNWRGFITP
jgi:hypothetical protein